MLLSCMLCVMLCVIAIKGIDVLKRRLHSTTASPKVMK